MSCVLLTCLVSKLLLLVSCCLLCSVNSCWSICQTFWPTLMHSGLVKQFWQINNISQWSTNSLVNVAAFKNYSQSWRTHHTHHTPHHPTYIICFYTEKQHRTWEMLTPLMCVCIAGMSSCKLCLLLLLLFLGVLAVQCQWTTPSDSHHKGTRSHDEGQGQQAKGTAHTPHTHHTHTTTTQPTLYCLHEEIK